MMMPKRVLRVPCPAPGGSDFQNFHPHLHVLATDGCFYNDAAFMVCPLPDTGALEKLFRYEVFKMLKAEGKITDVIIENMMNPADGGTDSTFIAAMPFGRTLKRAWKTWRVILFEHPFPKSA